METNNTNNKKCATQNEDLVKIVMGQTTYTEEQASEKLMTYNNDIYKVLREFMSIPEQVPRKITSINQTIYRELRNNLGIVDVASIETTKD